MKTVDYAAFAGMLKAAAAKIEGAKDELTELDSQIGDGDHGTTMAKVMELVRKTVDGYEGKDVKGLLSKIGMSILSVGGGATVPLYGSLFSGMARAAAEGPGALDAPALASMFEAGRDRLLKFSKAQPGDKTLVDALAPAVETMRAKAGCGADVMFEAAAEAAQAGSDSTKNLVAKHGRAMNLGERSLGIPDPGSVSMALIFRAFADYVKEA
jgi:dihydroxyacetone kinase-like protein